MADDGCLVDAIIDIVRRDAVLLDIDADCTDEGDVRLEARDEVERHTAPEAVAALVDLAANEDDADLRVAREHNEDVNHVRDDRDLELHLDEELCNGEVARRDVEEDHVLLVDEFDRCLRDALLRLDIRIAVFADFDHVAVLADTTAPPYVRLSLPFFSRAPRSLRMQSSVTLNFSLRSRTRTLPSRASMLRMMS